MQKTGVRCIHILTPRSPSSFDTSQNQVRHTRDSNRFPPYLAAGPANDGKMIPVARDPPKALERRGRHTRAAAALSGSSAVRSSRMPPTSSVVVALLPQLPLALPATPRSSSPRQAGDKHRLCQGVPCLRIVSPLALLSAAGQVDQAGEGSVRDCSFRSVSRCGRRRGPLEAAAFLPLAVRSVSVSVAAGGCALVTAFPADGALVTAADGAVVQAGNGFCWVRLRLVLIPEVVDREEVDSFEAFGHAEDALQVRTDAQAPYLQQQQAQGVFIG